MNASADAKQQLAFIDGRDALAFVILRPSPEGDDRVVVVDAGANGMSRKRAAAYLRLLADRWDPPADGQSGDDRG
jgi:hypothetical protein